MMLINFNKQTVTWFLNESVKIAEKALPIGKIYASFTFYGKSENLIL
jgi:hypothetical protein